MQADVIYNPTLDHYELTLNGTVLSTANNYGHWEYHFNRGTNSKKLLKHQINSFNYVSFRNQQDQDRHLRETKQPVVTPPSPSPVTPGIITDSKRGRGRPKKLPPPPPGVSVHVISDAEPPFRILTAADKQAILRSYQAQVNLGISLQEAVQYTAKQFYLSYKQTHGALSL